MENMEARLMLASSPVLDHLARLGGNDYDFGSAIAVDRQGNTVVAGTTWSGGWVSGGYDTTHNGNWDAFVAKLNPTGQVLWSTYLGGNESDVVGGIAVDSAGNIVVTGTTDSMGWVSGAIGGGGSFLNGPNDSFVVKLSPQGGLIWSLYLGGAASDYGNGIALGSADNILVAGDTNSSGWVSGGSDPQYNGGDSDGFAVKLNPQGQRLWSTYLGGAGSDLAASIAVDATNSPIIAGYTNSSGWVSGGADLTANGSGDGFLARLDAYGQSVWSTYIGGAGDDRAYGVAVDQAGNIAVAGQTRSTGWVAGGWDVTFNGAADAFVARFSPQGQALWSTYLGGSDNDGGYGIAIGAGSEILVTGYSRSSGWVGGGFGSSYHGGGDAFAAKLSPAGRHLWSAYIGDAVGEYGYAIAADRIGNVRITGDAEGSDGAPNDALIAFISDRDTSPPTVRWASTGDNGDPRSLSMQFSETVASNLQRGDLILTNLTTGKGIDPALTLLLFDSLTQTARWTFPGLPNGRLPDGRYSAVLRSSAIVDLAGNALDGDGDGNGGDDAILTFSRLAADFNGDARVDRLDFNVLYQHFGAAGTFSQGDANLNGVVDFVDFQALEVAYGKALPLLPMGVQAVAAVSMKRRLILPKIAANGGRTSHPRERRVCRPCFSLS